MKNAKGVDFQDIIGRQNRNQLKDLPRADCKKSIILVYKFELAYNRGMVFKPFCCGK